VKNPDLVLHCGIDWKSVDRAESKADDGEERSDENVKVVEGYASTKALDEVGDIVLPTAFDATLDAFMEFPNFFAYHDWSRPIGQIAKADRDDEGLWVRGEVYTDTTDGRDIWNLVKRRALRAFSIGFMIPEGGIDTNENTGVSTITALELLEISVVALPAQREATFDVAKQLKSWAAHSGRQIGRKRDVKELAGTGHAGLNDELQGLVDVLLVASAQTAFVTSQIAKQGSTFVEQVRRSLTSS
jgi:hypothetical protein